MDRRRVLACSVFFGLSLTSYVTAAVDPDVYLEHEWYEVELLVFQQANTNLLSNQGAESSVHRSHRAYPEQLNSFPVSNDEEFLYFDIDDHVDFTDSEGLFLKSYPVVPSVDEAITEPESSIVPVDESPHARDCAFHHPSTNRADVAVSTDLLPLEMEHTDTAERSAENDVVSEEPFEVSEEAKPVRDPRLPDWLPDSWQTFDTLVADALSALGLCHEDFVAVTRVDTEDESQEELPADDPTSLDLTTSWVTPAIVESRFKLYEADLVKSELTWSSENVRYQNTRRRLTDGGYRILGHGRWHQRIAARGQQTPTLIQLGDFQTDGLREVEGYIELSLGRFLHVNARLWFALRDEDVSDDLLVDPWNPDESNFSYYELSESRRLRSGEPHYLDHPAIGVLVRIDPLPLTAEMQNLIDELNERY